MFVCLSLSLFVLFLSIDKKLLGVHRCKMVYKGNLIHGIKWARSDWAQWSFYIWNKQKHLYIWPVLLFYSEWSTQDWLVDVVLWHLISVRIFGVMYYHCFSKLADHRWIEEKGYTKWIIIFLSTHATPGTPASLYIYQCPALEIKPYTIGSRENLLLQVLFATEGQTPNCNGSLQF